MTNPRPEALAREFWAGTGLQYTFPRQIEQAISMKLPLALVKLPLLTVRTIQAWLERRGLRLVLSFNQQNLLGSLVAYRGRGIIFVCGADEPAEQRLTVAHEVAHFLVDYLWPREQVIQVLGERITDVLDGLRRATLAERVAAILSRVHLGTHVHVLPRAGTDENPDPKAAYIEDRVDQLALELVAPRECVRSFLQNFSIRETRPPEDLRVALAEYFGLPAYAFDGIVQTMRQHRPISFLADVRAAIRRRQ